MSSYAEQYRPKRQSTDSEGRPLPDDFIAFVPYACTMMQAPFNVRFNYRVQDEYVSVEDKRRGKARSQLQETPAHRHPVHDAGVSVPPDESDIVLVTLVLTPQADVTELIFDRCRFLPCLLLKVIELTVPYQPRLERLSLRRCQVTAGLLRDLTSLVRLAAVTEVLLDDTPLPEASHRLLGGLPALRLLSLDRCGVGDAGAELLAAALTHPLPASLSLRALSLVSDGVGDRGARALGLALRSNRCLMHLNLAGNLLTDDGLEALLACLEEFPLTADELEGKRGRLLEHLRARRAAFGRIYAQLMSTRDQSTETGAGAGAGTARRRTRGGARSTAALGWTPSTTSRAHEALLARAETLTQEAVGTFSDPFSPEETEPRDGGTHCAGNMTLSYLNVAYNRLGYRSAARLVRVLRYQRERARAGLVRVVAEGNPLPICAELLDVQEMLERQLTARQKSFIIKRERRSRK